MLSGMQPTRVCPVCEERLTDASNAIRRHETEMHTALDLARNDELTDEQRRFFRTALLETLAEARLAWDTYCEHLAQHGLLPAP